MKKWAVCWCLLFGIAWGQTGPGPLPYPPVLFLHDAMYISLQSHPSLRRRREETRVEEAVEDKVVAETLPRLFGEATYKNGFPGLPNFSFRGLVQSSSIQDYGVDGVFQWTYDFGRTRFRARSQRHNISAAKAEEKAQMGAVALRVVRAYNGLLLAQALAALEERNLQARTTVARYARTRHRNGLISRVDVGLAESGLAEAEMRVIRAQNDVLQARAVLDNAMGIESITPYEVEEGPLPGEPRTAAPRPREELPQLGGSLEEDLRFAVQARPELESARARVRAGADAVKAAEAGYLPTFRLQATGGHLDTRTNVTPDNWAVGMALTFPFYTGGLVEAEGDEALHRMRAMEARADETINDIRLEVSRARLLLSSLLESRRAAAERVRQAADSERLATSRYQHGLSSILELQQAQLNLLNARTDEARLRYDTLTAFYALSYARGDILNFPGGL